MLQVSHSILPQGTASKASEITERADLYFFRPLGLILARLAHGLHMTPTQVTLVGALVGLGGGALLFDERLGLLGFSLLIVHGIIDSADGQLARMTGRVTEFGRVLDGVSGYITHGSIYLAIATSVIHRSGNYSILIWMLLASLANAIQAQMYEFYRRAYHRVMEGRATPNNPGAVPFWIRWLYQLYLTAQRGLAGTHAQVESRLAADSVAGHIRDEDRSLYRRFFYWPARGWGLLGDNTRFFAIGLLASLHRTDLFFAFVLGPMNLALLALWLWQRKADHGFLAAK